MYVYVPARSRTLTTKQSPSLSRRLLPSLWSARSQGHAYFLWKSRLAHVCLCPCKELHFDDKAVSFIISKIDSLAVERSFAHRPGILREGHTYFLYMILKVLSQTGHRLWFPGLRENKTARHGPGEHDRFPAERARGCRSIHRCRRVNNPHSREYGCCRSAAG